IRNSDWMRVQVAIHVSGAILVERRKIVEGGEPEVTRIYYGRGAIKYADHLDVSEGKTSVRVDVNVDPACGHHGTAKVMNLASGVRVEGFFKGGNEHVFNRDVPLHGAQAARGIKHHAVLQYQILHMADLAEKRTAVKHRNASI